MHRLFPVAVLDADGWRHDLADDEILARLLTRNLARAAAQGGSELPRSDDDAEEAPPG